MSVCVGLWPRVAGEGGCAGGVGVAGGGWGLRSRVAGVATTSVALPRVSAGAAVL